MKELSDQGIEFWYIAFSPCTESVPEGFDENVLYEELNNALAHLGIPSEHVQTHQMPVRNFPEHRQEILDIMIHFKKDVDPDLVILPNSFDIHQDPKVIHEEGVRAFKHSGLIGSDTNEWTSSGG